MRSNFRKNLDDLYAWIENTFRAQQRTFRVKKTLKTMDDVKYKNDSKYDEYLKYWKKYNLKPNIIWLRLYSKENEEFDPRYIPDNLWYGKILPYYCNMDFRRSYEDKNLHDKLFPQFRRPRTIVKCMAGIFYNEKNQVVNYDTSINLMLQEPKIIIKPSIDSGTGRLINFFESDTEDVSVLKARLDAVGQNYIVQEIVEQHSQMAALNPKTLNTIRIITFLFNNEVYVLSRIVRMGAGEARIDNVSAGGLQINVNSYGELSEFAQDKKRQKHFNHPNTGIKFEGFKVPYFADIVEQAKSAHLNMPHFKIIGWDFAVSKDGDPIFIEYNVMPGSNQMTDGPTFGSLTDEVLKDVFITKAYEHAQN